jgi:hypothetical protein
VTYVQADWGTVAELLRPTPERLASAKAWLIERLRDADAVGLGVAYEYALSTGAIYPGNQHEIPDAGDPANQELLIAYWQPWLDMRYALHEFAQRGLLVVTVQGISPDSPSIWDTEGPRVPLGPPGTSIPRPDTFPTVPLVNGSYRWSIGHTAEREARLELYDADLFLLKAELDVFDERVRRCVSEGLACYRDDLFLAAANMLGAASEAAWHQLAEGMVGSGVGGEKLSRELQQPNPSIARVQQHALADLRQLKAAEFQERFGFARSALDSVEEVARFWRDLRNYGMHPAGALAPETFSQASLAVEIMGASGYLGRLAALVRRL